MWVIGFAPCDVVVGRVWYLFGGVWVWVRGGLVASNVTVVGVVLGGCKGFHPRL